MEKTKGFITKLAKEKAPVGDARFVARKSK